ncbi:hypothetical protein D9756_007209 [Leucocoprinus leucothites]|uniref:DUF3752 domain-containing protein n=1 Tax=Leucocoprinus leucothites TaxID=201217 RepID=A0A8H5D648_9AGAR|nr:hypothetical protein D9756_007209 [Leucoagaricus leucothites]
MALRAHPNHRKNLTISPDLRYLLLYTNKGFSPNDPIHQFQKPKSSSHNLPTSSPTPAPASGPQRRTIGPPFPSHPLNYYQEDDSGDDDFGPQPLPSGLQAMHEKDTVAEFMWRKERRGSVNKGDNSLWTEIPAERQQPIVDEVTGKKRRAVDVASEEALGVGSSSGKRSKQEEESIREQSLRGPSPVEQHTSQKNTADEDDAPKAIRDYSRDVALGGRLMGDIKRDQMIHESTSLGDRFGSGKGGKFLVMLCGIYHGVLVSFWHMLAWYFLAGSIVVGDPRLPRPVLPQTGWGQ